MTPHNLFNLNAIHESWQHCIINALNEMNPTYLEFLSLHPQQWLPGPEKIFNAFTLPVDQVNYVLFGESPYPRAHSANGYAFWDAAVTQLWTATGMSKAVNRATSLRNIIKMLLVAEGLLEPNHTDQASIAALNKNRLVQTNTELFTQFINHGFLLLNATLVLRPKLVQKDALAWQPFIKKVLAFLLSKQPHVQFLLFGKIANQIDPLIQPHANHKLYAEHPYNLSFVQNNKVIEFFKPLHLLQQTS